MTITLPPDLAAALSGLASRQNTTPEATAVGLLRERLSRPTPRDDWERRLFGAAVDCGVSPSDAAVSSEGLYES